MKNLLVALLVASSAIPASATITQSSLAAYSNATILGFETAATGSYGPSDLFAGTPVSSIHSTATDFSDAYDARTGTTKAIWGDANDTIRVVSTGASGLANVVSYDVSLRSLNSLFGVTIVDQSATFTFGFFDGATQVGSTNVNSDTSANPTTFYFSSTAAFDRVTISNGGGGGFGLDNITLETPAAVPEPAMLGLFGMGAIGLGLNRRRKTA